MTQVAYLTVAEVIYLAQRINQDVAVRDPGLLDAAVHRPQAVLFGTEAYPTLELKAAALMQSLIGNHPLVDGNKRTGWLSAETFLALNGVHLLEHIDVDHAEQFTLSIAQGQLDDINLIARQLRAWTGPAR